MTRLLAVLLLLALAETGTAEDSRALLARDAPPWYDVEADAWRRVAPPERETEDEDGDFSGSGIGGQQLLARLLLIALIAALATIAIAVALHLLRNRASGGIATAPRRRGPAPAEARIGELPAGLEAGALDWEAELAAARRRGDHHQLVIAGYAAALLRLDAARLILLRRGSTNRAYLRELRPADDGAAAALATLVQAFEELSFGGRSPDAERAERCWTAWQQIETRCAEGAR